MGKGEMGWKQGEHLISSLESGFLADAFLVYNAFKEKKQDE